jgi:hypothetical protein
MTVMESDMKNGNPNFRKHAAILGAILGCIASFIVQPTLDGLAAKLNSPILHILLQWWPALFIVVGLIFLLGRHSDSQNETSSGEFGGGK